MKFAFKVLAVLAACGILVFAFYFGPRKGASEEGSPPQTGIEKLIAGGARVLFVCAHAEDLVFAAPLLAMAGPNGMALTLGSGGNDWERACNILGIQGRAAGFRTKSAEQGEPRIKPQDVKNVVISKWLESGSDPRAPIEEAIRDFKPDILLTFDADQGFTGDKEHRAVGELVVAVYEEQSQSMIVYCIVNRFPRMLGGTAPAVSRSQIVEIASSRTMLINGKTALEKATEVLEVFSASGSQEIQKFSAQEWDRLLRETALLIAAQRRTAK
ncbi:MAG: PIG-L family deacetylase [Fimbriimonadales bacterium]|nr:PIG-L family deacetylase [Fimbriimonadales bacterium]